MIAKYNKLDNQLQNINFQYLIILDSQTSANGNELINAKRYARHGKNYEWHKQ